jgi:hypothetical protein
MTAVEWLLDALNKQGISLYTPEIIEQSKQMENEQKIEFACQVAEASAMKYIQGKTTRMIAEELLTIKSE